jgi:16S rRNA (cytosine1402-N4)-methyltransferase
MRMDRRQPVSAAQLVNELEAGELATIFWELGGERRSRRIARAIVEQRDMQRIDTTMQLADTVERACPRRGARTHPATGVFQALRMAVNDELGQVQAGLDAAWSVLKPGGCLAVITFHSGEDRLVKQFSRRLAKPYTVRGDVDVPELREPREPLARELSRKAIKPSDAEVGRNPRSRSAQMRAMEKL